MPSDFVDRAKLATLADEYTTSDAIWPVRRARRKADFLAGVAAYAALLDAETTEEWGVQEVGVMCGERKRVARITKAGADYLLRKNRELRPEVVSRRVLYGPWLPSEGGEKP